MARVNINGVETEISDEEFQQMFGDMHFGFGGRGRRKPEYRWDHKMHVYESYSSGQPGTLWNEVEPAKLKEDFGVEPKFTKDYYFAIPDGREYNIIHNPVVAVFFNHVERVFLYMMNGGLVPESECFGSPEEVRAFIQSVENERLGHTVVSEVASGLAVKEFD